MDSTDARPTPPETGFIARMLEQTNALARVGGWWVDLERGRLYWTAVTRQIHEVGPAYVPDVATAIGFYKAGESRERIAALVAAAMRDGTAYQLEAQIVTATGRERWIRTIGDVELRDGRPVLLYGAIQDIDAEMRAQLALERARAEADRANQEKSLFLARVSHELRTPLNSMLGLADLLAVGEADARRRDLVSRLGRAGRHLRDLVNDAIDHERLVVGRGVLEHIPYSVREVADHCADQFGHQFRARRVAFAVQVDPGLPPWVVGDPTRLRQVLTNLLGNALRFTPAGGEVRVDLSPEAAGTRLRGEVVDTGPGIPRDRQQAIFEPFTQADESIGRTHGGTGLGLSICRQLVEGMGGSIGVDSEPGRGSRFWFELPLAVAEGPPDRQGESSRIGRPAHLGLRVLVAEDDEISRFTIAALLDELGCPHRVVADGAAAVEAWAGGDWDVILMDMQMPVLDGCCAVREIRAREAPGRRVPIFTLSASTSAEDIERALACGVDRHLGKPMSLSGLRRALRGLGPSQPC